MKKSAQSIIEYVLILALAIIGFLGASQFLFNFRDNLKDNAFKTAKDFITKPFGE